jgi:diguanylate cyclase (GGDEF)-like protein
MSLTWALLVVCAALAVPTALAPEGSPAGWTYLAGLTLIVAALWRGALTCGRGAARSGWRWLAAAASMWLAGDAVARLLIARGAAPDGAALADVFWLGSYPMAVAGVTMMIRGRGLAGQVRHELRLDVFVVTTAAGIGAWHLVLQPTLAAGRLDLATLLAVAYPLGDVAIFATAFTLLLAPGTRGPAGTLLFVCLGSTLVVDGLISALLVAAPRFDSARLDAVLLVANGCLGAAALHPTRRTLAAPPAEGGSRAHMHRWRILLLGAALIAVNVTVAMPAHPSLTDRVTMLASALAVSVTILVRFYRVVRDRESAEARLIHQAHHDQLTGLANRSLLLERLGAELLGGGAPERGGRSPEHEGSVTPRDLVLVYVDLDGFKAVNDRFGHAAGDEVLRVVGRRLDGATRAGDTVSRLGGDEFVVLCRDVPPEAAEALGDSLRAVVMEPIDVGAAEPVRVGASIGVYAASTHEEREADLLVNVEELLRVVDSAMYEAKYSGGGVRRAVRTL